MVCTSVAATASLSSRRCDHHRCWGQRKAWPDLAQEGTPRPVNQSSMPCSSAWVPTAINILEIPQANDRTADTFFPEEGLSDGGSFIPFLPKLRKLAVRVVASRACNVRTRCVIQNRCVYLRASPQACRLGQKMD